MNETHDKMNGSNKERGEDCGMRDEGWQMKTRETKNDHKQTHIHRYFPVKYLYHSRTEHTVQMLTIPSTYRHIHINSCVLDTLVMVMVMVMYSRGHGMPTHLSVIIWSRCWAKEK